MEKKKLTAYLAGTECFYANGEELAKKAVELCRQYGIEAISPVLGEEGRDVDFSKGKHEAAKQIYNNDMYYLEKSDMIIANLNPFRGFEPDSGTCVECGIAIALGKKCYAFTSDARSMKERYSGKTYTDENGVVRDENGAFLEDFEMPFNLMINIPFTVVEGELEDILKVIKKDYDL